VAEDLSLHNLYIEKGFRGRSMTSATHPENGISIPLSVAAPEV